MSVWQSNSSSSSKSAPTKKIFWGCATHAIFGRLFLYRGLDGLWQTFRQNGFLTWIQFDLFVQKHAGLITIALFFYNEQMKERKAVLHVCPVGLLEIRWYEWLCALHYYWRSLPCFVCTFKQRKAYSPLELNLIWKQTWDGIMAILTL